MAVAHKRFTTSRTRARKRGVDILFEADQKGFIHDKRALLQLLHERKTLSPAQTPPNAFTQRLVIGVADHIREIDDQIVRFTHGRSLDRLPAPERAILRIAVWEILFDDSVDSPVAINEAITLTKAIGGTDKSHNYVNAVLSAIDNAHNHLRYDDSGDDPVDDFSFSDEDYFTTNHHGDVYLADDYDKNDSSQKDDPSLS